MQSRLKDFADRCQGIINEAMKWAPKSTKSHLQEYPNQLSPSTLSNHSGLALAFDAVLQSSAPSLTNALLPMSNKRPQCVNSDTPRFVSVLCLRSKYAGEISGLLSVLDDDEKHGLSDRLIKEVWNACREKSDTRYRGALWRATAYLIICSGHNRKLLHAVCKFIVYGFFSQYFLNGKISKNVYLFAPQHHLKWNYSPNPQWKQLLNVGNGC